MCLYEKKTCWQGQIMQLLKYFLIRKIIPWTCNGTMRSYFRELHCYKWLRDLIFVVSALAHRFLNSTGHDPIKMMCGCVYRVFGCPSVCQLVWSVGDVSCSAGVCWECWTMWLGLKRGGWGLGETINPWTSGLSQSIWWTFIHRTIQTIWRRDTSRYIYIHHLTKNKVTVWI